MMSHINGNGLFIMEKDAGQISLTWRVPEYEELSQKK